MIKTCSGLVRLLRRLAIVQDYSGCNGPTRVERRSHEISQLLWHVMIALEAHAAWYIRRFGELQAVRVHLATTGISERILRLQARRTGAIIHSAEISSRIFDDVDRCRNSSVDRQWRTNSREVH